MAISAARDNNRIPMIMGTSNADGVTPVYVCVEPTHALCADDGITGASFSYETAQRDDNRVPVLWAVSSSDGITPIPIYADPVTNKLLIQTT